MNELRIDPEFRDKIPPLTEAEFKQLEENIVADGEVREPLITWNGTIIDGHHRWKIIKKHPDIPYKVKEMGFADKWAAIVWMCQNQIGRRNLTNEQRTYLIGKQYEAQKMCVGGTGANQFKNGQLPQSGGTAKREYGTAYVVAKEHGVGKNTVERAEHFASGLDAADIISPGFRDSILTGAVKAPKSTIAAISKMDEPEMKKAVQAIQNGERVQPIKPEVIESTSTEYNSDDLKMELDACTVTFFNNFEDTLVFHSTMIQEQECKQKIEAALKEAEAAIKKLWGYIS